MIGLKIKIEDTTRNVEKAADKAAFKNLRHAAASISKDMKTSLEKAPQGEPSEPGEPPHTHSGQFIKRAVRYDVDEESAVIGPIASIVGEIGGVHERGETYKGIDYPERPFAAPALERGAPRFGGSFAGSIGE